MSGRQLVRLHAVDYREVLLSVLYPGAQTSLASLPPAVRELRRLLPVSFRERHRILLRIDGGFGDDRNLHWLMPQGYQVLAKGYSGKRAAAYASRVLHSSCYTDLAIAYYATTIQGGWQGELDRRCLPK